MSQGRAVALRELWYLLPVRLAPRRSRTAVERRALRGGQRMHGYARRTVQLDRTSGTTSRVLHVRHDAGAYGYHGATVGRRFLATGGPPWWTIARIKPYARPHRWLQRLGFFRRTVVNAGQSDQAVRDEVLRRHGSMHVDEDRVVLERVDDGAPVPEFMVGKTADAAITLHLVPDIRNRYAFARAAANIQAMLRSHHGIDIGLSIARMDAVPINPGGKAKLIGSHDRAPAGG